MIPRSYAPAAARAGDTIDLSEDEAAHLRRVLRLADGDALRVFNGRGAEFDAVVELAGRKGARARLLAERAPAAEPRVRVTLAAAVLKGDAMDTVIRDAVMLGVAAILPVLAERSQTTVTAIGRGRRPARWQRVAVASAKQCGRATVPQIFPVLDPEAVAAALVDGRLPLPALVLAEPSALVPVVSITGVGDSPPMAATILTGPEGGWTPQELDRLAKVAQAVTLGRLTLRAETAPVVALSAFFARWNAF
jgi:16S rRNA (uracil1498-N3)-methyltransferase